MIKLVLNPETQPVEKVFEKAELIIGASLETSDLNLPTEKLEPIHLKIWKEHDRFYILNIANDPFVTLNGMPFGKRILRHFDLIQVGKTLIRFETIDAAVAHAVHSKQAVYDTQKVESILQKAMQESESIHPIASTENFTHHASLPPHESDIDIEELVRQVEALEQERAEPLTSKRVEVFSAVEDLQDDEELFQTVSKELSEDTEEWNLEKDEPSKKTFTIGKNPLHWKTWASLLLLLFGLFILIAGYYYIQYDNKRFEQELKAAVNVADIAMALKYAQIYHIKPSKQNWSDPDFIKNSLSNVVTHDYPSLANIDLHGQFTNTSYFFRIYTSSDFSRFLVIAQPNPSLSQWLIPKTSIVVDSNRMEMRKLKNLRVLNRLLVNPGTLDGIQAKEISKIVQQGDVLPLSLISAKMQSSEFSPPKAIGLIRPGAENLIYNAPRYYQLGETIMQKALRLTEGSGSNHEVARLKYEISVLTKMPHLIFYSSSGIHLATEAYKALASFAPQAKFLTAYITFDSKGKMLNSHLLMNDEHAKTDTFYSTRQRSTPVKKEEDKELVARLEEPIITKEPPKIESDLTLATKETDQTIQAAFNQLSDHRKQALQISKKQVLDLLMLDQHLPLNVASLTQAIEKYNQDYLSWQLNIGNYIEKTKLDHSQLSAQQIQHCLEQSDLKGVYTEYLTFKTECVRTLESSAIDQTQSLSDLHHVLSHLKEEFKRFEFIEPDLSRLKNLIRLKTIKKLNELVFFTPKNPRDEKIEDLLLKIFENGLITDAEEQKLYLYADVIKSDFAKTEDAFQLHLK